MATIDNVVATTCWQRLKEEKNSLLVDVRTKAEWAFVGLPDLSTLGKEPLCVEWQKFPPEPQSQDPQSKHAPQSKHTQSKHAFVAQLIQHVSDKNQPLYFLCRSGQRSLKAAQMMAEAGFLCCFNVVDGFEGRLDEYHHRGQKEGWKAAKLPWKQG